MFSSKLFRQALFLLITIAVLDYIAFVFYFHYTYWWYDVGLHFLSGACAGMAFSFFYFQYFKFRFKNKINAISLSVFFVLVVGVVWEIYELKSGDTSLSDGIFYYRDTASDIIIDLCGGFFGTLYSLKFFSGIGGRID